MSKSRMPLVLGLGAAGGIGYYLYSAGGSPKAAENKFESTSSLSQRRLCFPARSLTKLQCAASELMLLLAARKSMTYF